MGLLYDRGARNAAWELTRKWTFPQLLDFQGEVARHALGARGPGGVTARELAGELLSIARAGLTRSEADQNCATRATSKRSSAIIGFKKIAARGYAGDRHGAATGVCQCDR